MDYSNVVIVIIIISFWQWVRGYLPSFFSANCARYRIRLAAAAAPPPPGVGIAGGGDDDEPLSIIRSLHGRSIGPMTPHSPPRVLGNFAQTGHGGMTVGYHGVAGTVVVVVVVVLFLCMVVGGFGSSILPTLAIHLVVDVWFGAPIEHFKHAFFDFLPSPSGTPFWISFRVVVVAATTTITFIATVTIPFLAGSLVSRGCCFGPGF